MSMHFSANQFETSFKPHHLGNWEVSKRYKLWPRARRGATKIIADDRGHLLPGVQRAGSPWGNYRGTWKLPRRITRKLASDLNGSSAHGRALTSWEKRSSHIPLVESSKQAVLEPIDAQKEKEKRKLRSKKAVQKKSKEDSSRSPNEYQPYKKDEHDYSHTLGCDRLSKVLDTAQRVREDIESYSKASRSPSTKKGPLETLISRNDNDKNYTVLRSHSNESPVEKFKHIDDEKSVKSKQSSRSSTPKSNQDSLLKTPPLPDVEFLSAQHAKSLAQDNLKHHPLPDIVDNALFKSMQMKGAKIPGVESDYEPKSVAVGYKNFTSPGPTQCSKMKVHRPKTAVTVKHKLKSPETYSRPKTGFAHTKDLTEIDLALCWDLTPPRPEDEPKIPAHIDGSNGSLAPSVFTLVKPQADDLAISEPKHSSKKGTPEEKKNSRPKTAWGENTKEGLKTTKLTEKSNPSAVMDIINNNDLIFASRPPKQQSPTDKLPNSTETNGLKENKNPNIQTKTGNGTPDSRRSSFSQKELKSNTLNSSIDSEKLIRQKHYRSSPNLPDVGVENNKSKRTMLTSRPCMACETKDSSPPVRAKSEYKMAFKAGKPNSHSSSQSSTNRPHTAKPLAIPKPKTPFAKRSYSIGTLIPPFSLWPGTTGMEYPEHWRLASVYQHSYKPVEARKKPLLASVYK